MKHEQVHITDWQTDIIIKAYYDIIDGDIMKKHSMIFAELEGI